MSEHSLRTGEAGGGANRATLATAPRIGIWLGDSFAEISATSGETQRWFHPKKSLAEGLKETLLKINARGGDVLVASSRAEMSVARRQGSEPALLTTAGFETWARFGSATLGFPALSLMREWFPTSPEKIFGVARDAAVTNEDLEPIAAKLDLMKIRDVAIALLHGDRQPEHERAAAAFFRARGFNVTASHELPGTFEDLARIRRTVESAFAETVVQDDLASLRAAVEGTDWTIKYWTPSGVVDDARAATIRGGVEAALAGALPRQGLAYFFGLEEFLGFTDGAPYLLPVQPTEQIAVSQWAFPSWTTVDRGYEPGPMLFGKSHQLTLLDVLFVRDRLNGDIQGFSDRVSAKSSARILETLFTQGKNLAEPGRRAADAKEIAEDLESAFLERLAMDLAFKGVGSVFVAGPFASSVVPLLEKRCPHIKFKVDGALSIATAAASGGRP